MTFYTMTHLFLPKVTKIGREYFCSCPAHDDEQPSLHISEGRNGRILLHCFAGCSCEQVCNAWGISLSDLYPENPMPDTRPAISLRGQSTAKKRKTKIVKATNQQEVARYQYYDHNGNLVAVKHRYQYTMPDGSQQKLFAWQSSSTGKWNKPEGLTLYNSQHICETDNIIVCEGEKCCDYLTDQGSSLWESPSWWPVCTPNSGADNFAKYASLLQGKNIAILPDNDRTGHIYALHAAQALHNIARVKLVDLRLIWPTMPLKADIADYIELHSGDDSELYRLIADTPLWTPAQQLVPLPCEAPSKIKVGRPGKKEELKAKMLLAIKQAPGQKISSQELQRIFVPDCVKIATYKAARAELVKSGAIKFSGRSLVIS